MCKHIWYAKGITRQNNHYSSQDKLTRADPFYMRPRVGGSLLLFFSSGYSDSFGVGDTLNSVKYDIITNQRPFAAN